MAAPKETLLPEFAKVLQCKQAFVGTRLAVLGHFNVCGRCGGSGHYSYCQTYGTTCFGCSGAGKTMPKLTKPLLEQVEKQVAAGGLNEYLKGVAARGRAKKWMNDLMTAWKELPEVAKDAELKKHWSNQSRLCAAINTICSAEFDKVRKLESLVKYGRYDKATRTSTKVTDAEILEMEAIVQASLARVRGAQDEAISANPDIEKLT